ncbi:MAG TPA: hypothetical protein VGB30_00170 [bacterium]|jgi:hypothetical protein
MHLFTILGILGFVFGLMALALIWQLRSDVTDLQKKLKDKDQG